MSVPQILAVDPEKPDDGSPRCITEGCGKDRKWKGLCGSCYGQARALLDKHQLTWDDLERMGLIVADDKPFVAAFKRKLAEIKAAEQGRAHDQQKDSA